MKKVVLISDGWKRLITYAWVVGIMEAIQESLESFGIPLNDEMIWYGDFDYATGERYMEQMMAKRGLTQLSDAIICANDNIAAGNAYTEMIVPKYTRYCKEGIPCAMAFF